MNITLIIQCFPPLINVAGGVSKRYYKLCKCLIDEYNYIVTIVTPIDIRNSYKDIDEWLQNCSTKL